MQYDLFSPVLAVQTSNSNQAINQPDMHYLH